MILLRATLKEQFYRKLLYLQLLVFFQQMKVHLPFPELVAPCDQDRKAQGPPIVPLVLRIWWAFQIPAIVKQLFYFHIPTEHKKYLNVLQSNNQKIIDGALMVLINSYVCMQCGAKRWWWNTFILRNCDKQAKKDNLKIAHKRDNLKICLQRESYAHEKLPTETVEQACAKFPLA